LEESAALKINEAHCLGKAIIIHQSTTNSLPRKVQQLQPSLWVSKISHNKYVQAGLFMQIFKTEEGNAIFLHNDGNRLRNKRTYSKILLHKEHVKISRRRAGREMFISNKSHTFSRRIILYQAVWGLSYYQLLVLLQYN
jgi:hypothetical protein